MDWVSWPKIAWWCGVVEIFVVVPFIGVSLFFWRRLGMPSIQTRVWVRALAGWLALVALTLSVTFFLLFHNMKYGVGYCSYQADHDFWPKFAFSAIATLLLSAIALSTIFIPAKMVAILQDGPDERCLAINGWSQVSGTDDAPSKLATFVVTHSFANVVAASVSLFVAVALIGVSSAYFSTQQYFDDLHDHNFGFLLKEHEAYTAPVFIGEFGTSEDSEYFQHVVSYMASRDLDWAYWPLNPVRPRGGSIQPNGEVNLEEDPDEMIEDSWSFLKKDWVSVRQAWMYERIMRIMRWPSLQTGYTIPCNRLETADCGG
jgi:hypothetical protein